jgi:antitoxin component YwqK of YwqJK toxin-antitoxin module
MKIILLIINLLSFTFVYSQRTPFSDVEVNDNGYTLNGTPYTGNIYELYKSGQLKSEYEVNDGKLNGYEKLYWVNSTYDENKYLDSLKIKEYTQNLNEVKPKYDTKFKDSVFHKNKSIDLYYNEIGGSKKFFKIQNKDASGKLEGDKKEVYDNYLFSINKLDEYEIELPVLRLNISALTKNLNDEKNKPIYRNKREESYTYLNGSKTGVHKEFDKDENLVLEEILKDGVRNGSYKRYENGKIKEEGTYLNDKKEGLYTVHNNNNYRDVTTYSNGLKNGLYKKYNGDVVTIYGTYSNDLIEGEWKEFDNSGNIISESVYLNDTLNGLCKNYNGEVVIKEGQYTSGLMNGEWILRHNNGNITLESAYLNDTLNGVYKKYNGEVAIEEGQYTSGLMNGEWVFRYNNGNKKAVGKYVDGDGGNSSSKFGVPRNGREGEWKLYHENGKKYQVSIYVNGVVDGKLVTYFESGNLNWTVKYKNGTTDFEGNIQIHYHENGEKSKKMQYKNGEWSEYKTQKEIEEEKRKHEEYQNRIISCWMCSREFKYKNGLDEPLYDPYNTYGGSHYSFVMSMFGGYYCSKSCACKAKGDDPDCYGAPTPPRR